MRWPKLYHRMTFIRMSMLMLVGKREASAAIITEAFRFVPTQGHTVKITWLPLNNAAPTPNCYIGSTGVVEDVKSDGSFVLRMKSGASLIVNKKYQFEYINSTEYHNS